MGLGYDVFVSYAHSDNGTPVGSTNPFGWVTTLAANLNEGPNVFKKRFFIDHQLKPGDDFGIDLLTKVEQSSLLVLLLSQNYIDSAWCGKELEQFVRTHGLVPDKPADVFVVELFPYEHFTGVPLIIQNLRKRLIHAKFWHQPRDKSAAALAGYPSPMESGADGRDHYWTVLNELRGALDARLRAPQAVRLPVSRVTPPSPGSAGAPLSPRAGLLGTVLLADSTDDLEAQRNAVRIALEPEGIVVLPEGDYVGLNPSEFDFAIQSDLASADLFVQLLSTTVGRKSKGFLAPWPQLQLERALRSGRPIMQWCEHLPRADQISDPSHARLFDTEFIRATNLAEFKTAVIERLRADQERRDRAAELASATPAEPLNPSPHGSARSRRYIFVDDLAGERTVSERMRSLMREQSFSVRSLPSGTPLGNNGIDIKEILRPCVAGITLFADPAKVTAYNRLIFFLNQIAAGQLPLARWGVLMRRGTVASEFGIDSDDVVGVDEQGLADFLRAL